MKDINISKAIREKISGIEPGTIFGLKDLLPLENPQAVTLELSRLSKKGAIERLTKGKYFVPKASRFGKLRPSEWQILDQVIKENGGYFAGLVALNRIGVTTQIPSQVTIRGARSTRQLKIGNLTINIYRQGNRGATYQQSTLTDIIEAARLIKKTPDGNAQLTLDKISTYLKSLKIEEREKIKELLLNERPYVRALLGALMENAEISQAQEVKATLNPLTTYKIGISKALLPNKESWGII